MSMFNPDQESYMRYIFSVPREERCACGWDLLGRCLNPGCKRAYSKMDDGTTVDSEVRRG